MKQIMPYPYIFMNFNSFKQSMGNYYMYSSIHKLKQKLTPS